MSVDALQEKIRKTKNPCVLCLDAAGDCVPPQFDGLCAYYEALLRRLKGVIPGVRVSFGSFALLGGEGLRLLARITELAAELGYYVILDWTHRSFCPPRRRSRRPGCLVRRTAALPGTVWCFRLTAAAM